MERPPGGQHHRLSTANSTGSEDGRSRNFDGDRDQQARKHEESKEAIKIIQEMSSILNTGLDPEALGICIRLCETGANPKALAQLIKGWKQENALQDEKEKKRSTNGN